MRLWHKDLIPVLPRQQLLGQWRELCAIMRNIEDKGTPNHVLVNRVMDYAPEHLHSYAARVIDEMSRRGYRCNSAKFKVPYSVVYGSPTYNLKPYNVEKSDLFSGWMNDRYLRQCYYNLEEKHDCGAINDEDFSKVYKVCKHVL